MISAYDVVCSEKKANETSIYEHFIHVCDDHGLEEELLRRHLEYVIMADFILSGRDRHLNNLGILRNSESLKFVAPAPIYDSGKCLFVQDSVPVTDRELLNIKTESFAADELKLLKLVRNKDLLDVTKLPSRSFVEDIYGLDSQMDEQRISMIGEGYERKIELFRDFQLGQDLNKMKFAIKKPHASKLNTSQFIIDIEIKRE